MPKVEGVCFNKVYITSRAIDSATLSLAQTQIIAQQGNTDVANAVKDILGLGQAQVASTGDIGSDLTSSPPFNGGDSLK